MTHCSKDEVYTIVLPDKKLISYAVIVLCTQILHSFTIIFSYLNEFILYVFHWVTWLFIRFFRSEKSNWSYQYWESNLELHISLTLWWRRLLSYRNQSIDLDSKSMDWFLYDKASVMKKLSSMVKPTDCNFAKYELFPSASYFFLSVNLDDKVWTLLIKVSYISRDGCHTRFDLICFTSCYLYFKEL